MKAPSKSDKNANFEFDSLQTYTISFNCMRNGLDVPISYALGIVYSLYDLAERGLEVYHTSADSFV